MAFQKEATSSYSLLEHLRRRLAASAQKSAAGERKRMEVTERAYEIAGDLESGAARELTDDVQHPLKRSPKLLKFKVTRSKDELQYSMRSEAGHFLMYAKASMESRKVFIYAYDPDDREQASLFDARRPAFTLSWNDAGSDWRLVEELCMRCHYGPRLRSCAGRGGREVARVRHLQRLIGHGVFNGMEIAVAPLRPDGCGPAVPPCVTGVEVEPLWLCTREPRWSTEVESLVLNFGGRSVMPCAKNFQLISAGRYDHVVCQYAKIGNDCFSLDFRHPMSVVQAFGISLSTLLWQ